MSDIIVTGPDGSRMTFPAGTPEQDIVGAMSSHYAAAPAGSMEPVYDAMGNATGQTQSSLPAPAQVAENQDAPGFLESFARGGVQGATLGGGDELLATGAGALAKVQGQDFGPAFNQQLATTQANNKAASEANPWTYTAGQAVGAIPGLMYGATYKPVAYALGLAGRNLLTRSAASAGGSAALGAVQGYLGSDGDHRERASGAGSGAMWGGGFGLAGPTAGIGIGAGVRHLADNFRPSMSIRGLSPAAVAAIADDIAASGGSKAVNQRMAELGSDAMLVDASPSFQGRAQGLAVRPETREIIVDPMKARDLATNQRLRTDLDETLGPARPPAEIEAGFDASRDRLQPRYTEELRNAPTFDPSQLIGLVRDLGATAKGQTARYLTQAEELLAPMRQTPQGRVRIPDTTPEGLLATRKGLDGLIARVGEDAQAIKEGAHGVLSTIRQAVDDQMRAISPEVKVLDRAYQSLSQQSDALAQGGRILDSGKTAVWPSQLDDAWATMIPAERRALAGGTRAELERLVGNHPNDLEALRQAVKGDGDWNRAKLSRVFGADEADRIFRSVDREMAFRDAYRRINENSMSGQRLVAERAVRPREGAGAGDDLGTIVATATGGPAGFATAMGVRGLRAANSEITRVADIARNLDIAKFLVKPNDPEVSAAVEMVARSVARRKGNEKISENVSRLAQTLMAIEGDTARRGYPDRLQLR